MNIKSLVSNIIECIDYYEKRCFEEVEADCRNLERKYDNNDNTAQGFLVAIRKQEHWDGENFEEIAKELLTIRNSKISRYLVIRSIDCTLEIIEKVFDPQMYSKRELQGIARVANSNKILEMIFEYVKYNIGKVNGYTILCCIANNAEAKAELLNELYLFDQRLSVQIFLNKDCKASTELLMKMFYECDDEELKEFYILQMVQFNRVEINEQLKNYLVHRLIQILKK